MSDDEARPLRVVLTPELIGRALHEQEPATILAHWRDRRLVLVLNRPLLIRYLRVLGRLGLHARLVRRWGWWFTASSRTLFTIDPNLENLPFKELCSGLARKHSPCRVVHGALSVPPSGDQNWIGIDDFIARFPWLEPSQPDDIQLS